MGFPTRTKARTISSGLVFCRKLCYSLFGAASNGRRLALFYGGSFFAPDSKGGDDMVTYAELFQYTLVLIGIVALIIQAKKK